MTRILVVDDSRVIRNAASKMLGHEFDVVTAEDGADAWSQLEQDPSIQVVFTDLQMPGLNGFELLRNIRTAADTGIQNLPVIIVTGVDEDEVARVRALELGATDFITKPFTTIDLVARARSHASYQRITKELRAQTTLDSLTGLANKAGFLQRLQQDIAYARRHHHDLTLVCIEIDEFRNVFLKHGKDTAEKLLTHVAQQLRTTIRKEDTAGRIGLGGFALSLPAGDQHGVEGMVSRLRAEVAQQWTDASGQALALTLRAVVFSPDLAEGPSAQEVFDQGQARLAAAQEAVPQPVVATPIAPPAVTPAPVPAAPPSPLQPTAPPPAAVEPPPAHAEPPLRIDPLLEQIEQGNPQLAIGSMAQILRRLMPLLRLLNPTQRGSLMRFLQQLDKTQH
jgi:diguanylate cyclase (GGDEF)-like protein